MRKLDSDPKIILYAFAHDDGDISLQTCRMAK